MKLTRSQVAEMLQITPRTLATWEASGKVPPPQRDWRGWRLYEEQDISAIRQALGGESPTPVIDSEPGDMQISARNRLRGVVKEITGDGILCEVVLDLGAGHEVVSVITRASVQRLGLKIGVQAYALIKSTEVMIAR